MQQPVILAIDMLVKLRPSCLESPSFSFPSPLPSPPSFPLPPDQVSWTCRPATVMRSLTGQVLHSRLDASQDTTTGHLYRDLNESFTGSRLGFESEVTASKAPESKLTQTSEEGEEEGEEEEADGEEEFLTPTEVSIEFSVGGEMADGVEEEDHDEASAAIEMVDQTYSGEDDPVQLTGYKMSVV